MFTIASVPNESEYLLYSFIVNPALSKATSWFTKKDFSYSQMEQIVFGLEENLDVSIYAKTEYNWKEMQEIREKLLKESTL